MAETRWLDSDEQETWRSFLLGTRLLFANFERDMQVGAGLPLTYYEVLSMLSEAPGSSLRMSALASALQVSPSRISHAVSRLEDDGLVRREVCGKDRRSYFAVLTDAGGRVVLAAAPVHVESVRQRLFDALTPEQLDCLGTVGQTLLHRLSPDREEGRDQPALTKGAISAGSTHPAP